MKRRYLYVLLFGVPALLAALLAALVMFAAVAGVLWLFVYGDNPWPPMAETLLATLFAVTSLSLWGYLLRVAWLRGKQCEDDTASLARPALVAAAVTLALVVGGAWYEWRVGNLGPKSDGLVCADYCQAHGFSGSSMPPRNSGVLSCSCSDSQGREAVTVPLQDAARQ